MKPCDDRGCLVPDGEWCDFHEVVRWTCRCLDDDLDSRCPVCAPHDEEGRIVPWQAPDYDGYPPDDQRALTNVEIADGTYLVIGPDAFLGDFVAGEDLFAGSPVYIDNKLEAWFDRTGEGIPDGITMTSALAGDSVQIIRMIPVPTSDVVAHEGFEDAEAGQV